MGKMIDAQCNVEFPSDALYLVHKKAGHKGGLEKATPIEAPPLPTPPPGVMPESAPSPEFLEMVSRIERKKETPPESNPTPSQHPSELPQSKPISLEYHYSGECPDCRTPIATLEIDVEKKHFCIAFCSSENKQLQSREVAKL